MNVNDLISKGYFPKELPPCFTSENFGNNYNTIKTTFESTQALAQQLIDRRITQDRTLTSTQKREEKIKAKRTFSNRIGYSDCVQYAIPKPGIARNTIRIPNPLHMGKLMDCLCSNYSDISLLFEESKISTTKPSIENEIGQDKRAVRHDSYRLFKEKSILNSYKYSIQLKTDIAKFYSSIYTHTVPWVTFGGKERYKKNRALANVDPSKIQNIYGDDIDSRLMWCQNQQTMGIPIGPDSSLIISEIIACHMDKLFSQEMAKKKIDYVGFRYYDDYLIYFNSELDAQIGLTSLKNKLSEFELKINDDKTSISKTSIELERDWVLGLKMFFFRPNESNQQEDIWSYFSLSFRYARDNPNDSVLKFSLNKFDYVRIEKENWDVFESLLFRLGLIDTSTLQKIAKLLVTYKSLANKVKVKAFCIEVLHRHTERCHDYELTWALWILNFFDIQLTKDIYIEIFNSKSVCASIIALDLLSQNNRIKNFDFSEIISLVNTDNLNEKYWLLVYECVYNGWITGLPNSIITDHFFFNILLDNNVCFYDETISLQPLKVNRSCYKQIERKVKQIEKYIDANQFRDRRAKRVLESIFQQLLIVNDSNANVLQIENALLSAETQLRELIEIIAQNKEQSQSDRDKRMYFVLGKRVDELYELSIKEISNVSLQGNELLFDEDY